MAVRLKFRGFLSKRAFDAFAKLKLRPRQRSLEVGKAFTAQIFKLRDKGLELFDALSEVVDRKRFRPRPLRFCACHRVWEKCSPRPVQ
jgi:hypothetical protein